MTKKDQAQHVVRKKIPPEGLHLGSWPLGTTVVQTTHNIDYSPLHSKA